MSRLFSVVVPLYNKEEFVGETIRTVLEQSYPDFELLVIDDGSTDKSVEVVSSFADDRLKLFRQANAGVSAARNKGIEVAMGTHIAFLDADDLWSADFLNNVNRHIECYPDARVFATSYSFLLAGGKYRQAKFSNARKLEASGIIDDYFALSLKDPLITSSSIVLDRAVFSDVRPFAVGHGLSEDVELWARLAARYTVAFFNVPQVIYKKDSVNNSRNNFTIKSDFVLLETLEQLIADQVACQKSLEKYYLLYLYKCSRRYLLSGMNNDAVRVFLKLCRKSFHNCNVLFALQALLKLVYIKIFR